MNHPVWEVELGGGLVIAAAAVLHVFAAQLSAGTAVLLPALEGLARRRADAALLGWLRRQAGFLAFGLRAASAVAGAGTWFALTAVAPASTEALVRAQLWPFAITWVAFAVELAAGLAYARGFDRLPPRTHLAVGWLGAGAALAALLLSDATLAWTLEPAASLEAAGLAALPGTPFLLPSALLRLAAAAGLGGLAVLATAWREPAPLRGRLARLGALAALPGALLGPAAARLALRVAGPDHLEVLQGEVRSSTLGWQAALAATALGAAGLAAVAWLAPRRPRAASLPVAAALLALGLVAAAGGELVREAVRKPWSIGSGPRGAMYANGLTPDQLRVTRREGLLPFAAFSAARQPGQELDEARRGAQVFRLACRACHTVSGYRAIRRTVDGLPPRAIAVAVGRLDRLRGRMPPFPGSPAEARALTAWLASLDGVVESPPPPPPPGDLLAAGRRVLEERCLVCHRDIPLAPRVAGWTAAMAYDALGRLPRLQPAMPPFGGDDEERRALAAFLAALGAGQVE